MCYLLNFRCDSLISLPLSTVLLLPQAECLLAVFFNRYESGINLIQHSPTERISPKRSNYCFNKISVDFQLQLSRSWCGFGNFLKDSSVALMFALIFLSKVHEGAWLRPPCNPKLLVQPHSWHGAKAGVWVWSIITGEGFPLDIYVTNQIKIKTKIWFEAHTNSLCFHQSRPAALRLMHAKHFQSNLKQLLTSVQPYLNSPLGI